VGGAIVAVGELVINGEEGTLPVHFMDDALPRVFAVSPYRGKDLEAPPVVRYALSMARYAQDPLLETAYLWYSVGDSAVAGVEAGRSAGVTAVSSEVLSLPLHELQGECPPRLLLGAAERVMVEAVAAVGVDVNAVHRSEHLLSALYFCPGLGPRKAKELVNKLSRPPFKGLLRSRQDLKSEGLTPPTVWLNLCAFLRVGPAADFLGPRPGTRRLADVRSVPRASGKKLVEEEVGAAYGEEFVGEGFHPLDSSRVHPLNYDLYMTVVENMLNEDSARAARGREGREEEGKLLTFLSEVTAGAGGEVVEALHRARHRLIPLFRPFCARVQATTAAWLAAPPRVNFAHWHQKYTPTPTLRLNFNAYGKGLEPGDGLGALDLSAFAEELGKLGAKGGISDLELIAGEMRAPFRDARRPFEPMTPEALFRLMVGESCATLRVGSLVTALVARVEESRVLLTLEGGLKGYIRAALCDVPFDEGTRAPTLPLSTKYRPGQPLQVRVEGVERGVFKVEGNHKAAGLGARAHVLDPRFPICDAAVSIPALTALMHAVAGEFERAASAAALETGASSGLLEESRRGGAQLRSIGHPNFKNVTMKDAEDWLKERPLHDVVFRPSSKGLSYLNATWKLEEPNLCAHVEIEEEAKDPRNPSTLGRRLLVRVSKVETLEYGDLDEVLARHFDPMSTLHCEMKKARVYREVPPSKLAELLKEELAARPGHVAYFITPNPANIGYYQLCYIINKKPHHESVAVVPGGFRWRAKVRG
jgi:hypothetical protein